MTRPRLLDLFCEAIPPAYTEHIGQQLMAALQNTSGPHDYEPGGLTGRDPLTSQRVADQGNGGAA